MKQTTFVFDDEQPMRSDIHIEGQPEQRLVEWMAQAIVCVFQDTEGDECDNP